VFVSKSDVRKWPVIGRLLECAGTILADRSRRSSASATSQEILRVIECGLPVVLFPEGTSSDGSSVLPFKPSLLQIALDIHKPITPAAISYTSTTGDLKNDVCYWGDHTFVTHLFRLAKIRNLSAHLAIGHAPPLPDDRKAAALTLHAEVSAIKSSSPRNASSSSGKKRVRGFGIHHISFFGFFFASVISSASTLF
jgi:1-acyl-sn-glycerol-3-phosphate acyltransferase